MSLQVCLLRVTSLRPAPNERSLGLKSVTLKPSDMGLVLITGQDWIHIHPLQTAKKRCLKFSKVDLLQSVATPGVLVYTSLTNVLKL